MGQKSHRVSHACYRSGVWSLRRTNERRLDGYRVYSAADLPVPAEFQAGGGSLRPGPRQFGRRRDLAQGDRPPAGADRALGRVRERVAAAGEGPALDPRVAPAARLRAGLGLPRLQRRRPAGPRPDPQAAARPRSAHRGGLEFAADPLALREQSAAGRPLRHGRRLGRHGHRDASAPLPGAACPTHHPGPGHHRGSHPRPAAVRLVQWVLRYLVLSAAARHADVQQRAAPVFGGRPAAARDRRRHAQRYRPAAPPARQAPGGLPALLRVRLDGGFTGEPLFAFLEAAGVEYVVGMAGNTRLAKRVRRLQGRARMQAKATGESVQLFGDTRYQTRKWSRKRRIIMKAEVLRYPGRAPKNNPRFVVTNLPPPPAAVYACYAARGDMENRVKELKLGLALDRTSCARFRANQFRVLLTAATYVLFQELQRCAQATPSAVAQVSTLRQRLLKVAVWVERSVRRIVLHLPTAF